MTYGTLTVGCCPQANVRRPPTDVDGYQGNDEGRIPRVPLFTTRAAPYDDSSESELSECNLAIGARLVAY